MSLIAEFGAALRSTFSRVDKRPPQAVAIERQIAQLRSTMRTAIDSMPTPQLKRMVADAQIATDLRALNADQPQAVSRVRVDDFRNMSTGIGARGIDKRIGLGQWGYAEQSEFESRFMWRGSDMANRAVSLLPEEMFREGFRIRVAGDKALSDDVERLAFDELGPQLGVLESLKFARAFGGCGLFLGADDGTRDLAQPLNEDRIRSFDFVQPFSPLEMVPASWYADPLRGKFGTPETYRLTPLDTPPGWSPTLYQMPIIHESRLLKFQGNVSWRGQIIYNIHPGWGDSVFVRIRQVLEDFEQAWGSLGILISDFAVATLKIKNLAELMSAGNVSLEDRAQVLERGRSVARVTIIDSEEEYKRETTTVTGLPELLDRACNRLAGAMDIPVSRLLGEAPAGLNATGDSDIRWWYGTVDSERKSKAKPPLERIVRLRFLAQNGPTHGKVPERSGIYFPSLWRPSEKEAAEIRFQQAQTDQIYINTGVLMVSEVAKSRFGGEEYSVDTQLDADARGSMNEIQDVPEKEPLVELPNGTKQTTDVPVVKGENLGFGDAIHDQPRAIDGRVREGTAGPTKFAGHSAKQLHEKLKEIGGDKDHPDASEFAVEMRRRGLDADSLAKAAKQARPRDANRTR